MLSKYCQETAEATGVDTYGKVDYSTDHLPYKECQLYSYKDKTHAAVVKVNAPEMDIEVAFGGVASHNRGKRIAKGKTHQEKS